MMRVKCITGTFEDENIYLEITDAAQKSIGEIVTPDQWYWTEEHYPGTLKKVESELFYYNEEEFFYDDFFYIEEKHPFFNIDLVCEALDTDDPEERQLYLSITRLLKPYINKTP